MKTKIQIKTGFGSLLFEFEKENNSLKETIMEAVKNGANLRGADLRGADLRGADLYGADLKRITSITTILPAGELIVWKKLREGYIAKLLIPTKAKRVNAIGYRKCRFEYADVIAIYDGKKRVKIGHSKQYQNFVYEVGKRVIPDSFDPSPLIECSNGISAFITKQEAIDY